MNTSRILAELRSERDRIDQAIAAIESLGTHARGRRGAQRTAAPNKRRGRRSMSAAARKRMSMMMKKRWAERRKAAKG